MGDFAQFYQQGGVFMHAVTLLALACGGALAAYTIQRRTHSPSSDVSNGLIRGLLRATLLFGAVGTTFGFMDMFAAVATVPPPQQIAVVFRALPLVLTPIAWALMLVAPLTLVRTVLTAVRHRPRVENASTT